MKMPCRRCCAFSMVELVIVILIIGIMTALAIPRLVDSIMEQRVESAARRIKGDIELARRDAMAKSAQRMFDFTSPTRYVLQGISSLDHPGEEYSVDLAATPYEVEVMIANFSGFDNFAFTGYGLPTRGGEIRIQAGNHSRWIHVDEVTGEVTIVANE